MKLLERRKYSVIIVDDEADSQITLSSFLHEYCPETQLISVFSGVQDCLKGIKVNPPDILLLDINMSDGTGFDILNEITELSTKVIFITGYDSFAVDAFRYKVSGYLLKPVNPKHLEVVIAETIATIELEDKLSKLESSEENHQLKSIGIPSNDTVQLTDLRNIIRCEANGNYTYVHFTDRDRIIIPKTIKIFEGILSENGFVRIHQSHLINKMYLSEIRVKDSQVLLKNGDLLSLSRKYKSRIVQEFKLKVV